MAKGKDKGPDIVPITGFSGSASLDDAATEMAAILGSKLLPTLEENHEGGPLKGVVVCLVGEDNCETHGKHKAVTTAIYGEVNSPDMRQIIMGLLERHLENLFFGEDDE